MAIKVVPSSTGRRTWEIRCSGCDRRLLCSVRAQSSAVATARADGWVMNERILCPACEQLPR